MTDALNIVSVGAVTAVGLSAAQTCSAFRARLSGISEAITLIPEVSTALGAPVVARSRLRERPLRWLTALAVRAIQDALTSIEIELPRVVLLLAVPEPYRSHPALEDIQPTDLLQEIKARLGSSFHGVSRVLLHGHASALQALADAQELLRDRSIDACLVGGVDSLLNEVDVARLQACERLHGDDNPQGVIPGEGAAFVLLRQGSARGSAAALASVAAVAFEMEADLVSGDRYSTGTGLERALQTALRAAGCAVPDLSMRVSDMNGERYRAWESVIAAARFYRSRLDRIPGWFPAGSVGDIGAASGALSLVIAATGIARGYAPGPWAVCEGSSDEGLRAACVLTVALGAPRPPFRSRALAEASIAA